MRLKHHVQVARVLVCRICVGRVNPFSNIVSFCKQHCCVANLCFMDWPAVTGATESCA